MMLGPFAALFMTYSFSKSPHASAISITSSATTSPAFPSVSSTSSVTTATSVSAIPSAAAATSTYVVSSKTLSTLVLVTLLATGGTTGVYITEPSVFADMISSDILTSKNLNPTTQQSTTNLLKTSMQNIDYQIYGSTSSKSVNGESKTRDNSVMSTSISSITISKPDATKQTTQNTPLENSIVTSIESIGNYRNNGSAATDGFNFVNQIVPNNNQQLTPIFKHIDFKHPGDIVIDSLGNIYLTNTANHRIEKFDPSGKVITSFGIRGSGPGQFFGVTQIVLDSKENIYATDSYNHRIQKFDSDGNFMMLFGKEGDLPGQFKHPTGIVLDSNDNIYVADMANHRIQKFDSSGNFIMSFGEKGSEYGQFDNPRIVKLDSNDNIYVADMANHRIQKFDSSGNFIMSFGEKGSEYGQFDNPRGITLDSGDRIYVLDSKNYRIQKFDSDGNFIMSFGVYGSQHDQFSEIREITIDSNDNIYVADVGNDRITQISFEDAIESFSGQFDEIICDTDSMINNPISVPPEIAAALPISELLPRADSLAFDTQQYKEGLFFYYIASQIEPTNVNAWNGIGYTQTQICSNDSAEIAYAQSLSIDSNNVNARIGLADFTINQVTNEDNPSILKLEDAELQLQSVLDLDPRNTNALNALGYIETLRENYNKSIDYYQTSLKVDSKKTTTLNGLSFAHLRSDNLDEAIIVYLQVLNIDSNNFNALIGLITTYTQQGFPELAEQFVDKLDESNGMIADRLVEQGNWLQQNGHMEEAQRLFDAAAEINPILKIKNKLLSLFLLFSQITQTFLFRKFLYCIS